MQRFERLELRSGRQADFGSLVAILPAADLHTIVTLEDQVWTSRLEAKIPWNWDQSTNQVNLNVLIAEKVLSVLYKDGSRREFPVETIQDASGADGLISLSGRGLIYDLARQDRLLSQEINGQVRRRFVVSDYADTLLDFILGFAPATWVRGRVNITPYLTLEFDNNTVLQAIIQLCTKMSKYAGLVYDIHESFNPGTVKYEVHIEEWNGVNSSEPPAHISDFRFGKNLLGVNRILTGQQKANRCEPYDSEGIGIEDNWWIVSNSDSDSFEMGLIGGGACPILEVYQLVGQYIRDQAGGLHEILASDPLTNTARITVDDMTGIADGDWVQVVRDSSGNPVRYVEKPSDVATFKVALAGLPRSQRGLTNVFRNADVADWPGTIPVDWHEDIGSLALLKETLPGLWLTGGQSIYVPPSGPRIVRAERSWYCRADALVTYTVWIYILGFSFGGVAGIEFFHPDGGLVTKLLDGTDPELGTLGTWLACSQTFKLTAVPGVKTLKVRVRTSDLTNAEVIIDAAQAVFWPSAVPFVLGSGGSLNWIDGIAYIREHIDPAVTYKPRVADVSRLDGTRWPYDEIVPGGSARMTDDVLRLSGVTPKIVAIDQDELNLAATVPTLSTRRPTLSSLLVAAGL